MKAQPQLHSESAAAFADSRRGLSRRASYGVPPIVHEALRSPSRPLDTATRSYMEPRFGRDFSGVRVHTGPQATESARSISALAYTVGQDVVLGNTGAPSAALQSRRLIAHELAHVVQQGGRVGVQHDDLPMTRPGDASEREADAAAAVVTRGDAVSLPTNGGIALARQIDAAAPTPAPSSGFREAGPSAGSQQAGSHQAPAPVPAQVPPKAAPAPAPAVAAKATFGAVSFRGTANRIAPTRTAAVTVTLNGLHSGASAKLDVEGSGGVNGSATITSGATLARSRTVTVRGDAQTKPGNANALRIRATVGGTVIGRSAGFTIAAYPINYTATFACDIDDGIFLGMEVEDGWSSDGSGAISELDEVEISERVDEKSRDKPPFMIAGAASATYGTSKYMDGDAFTIDRFQMAKAGIKTTGLSFGEWNRVQGQLSLFKCNRTAVTDVVMPASGFKIIQKVTNDKAAPGFRHQTFHVPASIIVEGRSASAGWGTAESLVHRL